MVGKLIIRTAPHHKRGGLMEVGGGGGRRGTSMAGELLLLPHLGLRAQGDETILVYTYIYMVHRNFKIKVRKKIPYVLFAGVP